MNRAPLRPARRGSPRGGSSAPRRLGRPLRRALPLGRALLLGLALAAPAAQTAGPVDPDEAATAHSVLVLLPLPPEAAASAGGEHGRPPPGHAERHRLALQLARSHGLTLGEAWPVPAAAVAKGWRLVSAPCGSWLETITSITPLATPSTMASRSASLRKGGRTLRKV